MVKRVDREEKGKFALSSGFLSFHSWDAESPREADHGGTAVAVVGIHAEADGVRRGIVFEADGSLAPGAADDVKGGVTLGAVGLRVSLDRGRAHCGKR